VNIYIAIDILENIKLIVVHFDNISGELNNYMN